jgi:hypothetical protein
VAVDAQLFKPGVEPCLIRLAANEQVDAGEGLVGGRLCACADWKIRDCESSDCPRSRRIR